MISPVLNLIAAAPALPAHCLLAAQRFLEFTRTNNGVLWVLVGAGLFGGIMLFILLLISTSVKRIQRSARQLAEGDLSQRVEVAGPLQLSQLAESLNEMAQQLADRLAAIEQQRNELGAVLTSMVEGVLAIDSEERLLSMNRAAADLLNIEPSRAIGRPLQEVIRNAALQRFVAQTLREKSAVQGEVTLQRTDDQSDRFLQVQSAILRDGNGRRMGAVIVLHDVTQLRRLEVVRQDFVANVSHEVKTPVSAIKAAVETLLGEQEPDPADVQQFLKIISRQADRLAAIVDDLLSLARIEQESGEVRAQLEPGRVAPVLQAAVETCQAKADQRKTRISVQCNPQLKARMNPRLLEQAVVNLLDNAIKYSPEGTQVVLSGEQRDGEIVIAVTDEGRGIEPAHLPRLFERFYRTDKARSRAMGGTGLGLSIVKHVAQAHGGRVSVDSSPGRGSTFQIHLLPASAPDSSNADKISAAGQHDTGL